MGLSWCDSVLSANQAIFMCENFFVGGCMYYYIGATISHGDAHFFSGGGTVRGIDMFL